MPQMSPLLWAMLFLFFLLMLILTMIKMYFYPLSSLKMNCDNMNKMMNKKTLNWMW